MVCPSTYLFHAPQDDTFINRVWEKDQERVVSDEVNDAAYFDIWDQVDAAHTFTIYYEKLCQVGCSALFI